MHNLAFPDRKTDGARRIDQELATVLEQMTNSAEAISVRAVIRRMTTLRQPSSITRDGWRMSRIAAAEQERVRKLADGSATLNERSKTSVVGSNIVPDIRHLLSFVCLARIGNFGRAARELQVSQPTLSRQAQTLEKVFATKLLIRHGRGVTLTQAGSRLLRRLDTALPLLTSPLDQGRGADRDTGTLSLPDVAGAVSFGVIPGIGRSIIPLIVSDFGRDGQI